MPFSLPNSSAYFWMMGVRSTSAQITRSAAASRTGAAVDAGAGAAALVVDDAVAATVVDPPQALMSSAATPVTAAAPIARLCIDFSLGSLGQPCGQPLGGKT